MTTRIRKKADKEKPAWKNNDRADHRGEILIYRTQDSRTEWKGPMGTLGIRGWLPVTLWVEAEDELNTNIVSYSYIY